MASAGSITVDLLMRTGSFVTDTDRASKSLKRFQADAVQSAARAATALTAMAGAATAAFFALERGAAAIGKFKDFGDVIGDSGEAVASLQTAADVSGRSIEQITAASVKLTTALSKTDDEASNAGIALKALNLPLEDFKKLSPVAQLEAVAKGLGGLADNARKTEIAVALFGKAGAELLPFLKELDAQGGRRTIISQAQIDAADKFSDTVTELRSTLTQLGQSVLAEALPPFQAFVDELGKAEGVLEAFKVAGAAVRIFFETIVVLGANVAFVFKAVGREAGAIAAQLAALARGDLAGFSAISDAVKEDAKKARKELDDFEKRILFGLSGQRLTSRTDPRSTTFGRDPRPSADTSGLVKPLEGSDPTKKLLENRLKDLDRAIKAEQDLLTQRNHALDGLNAISLQSFQAYYDAQIAIIEAGGSAQLALIDKQIDEINKARNKKGLKPTEQADLEGKLQELQDKRAASQLETDRKIIDASQKKAEAEKRFQQQLDATRASVLELQGDLAGAAAIRFDQQNNDLRDRAIAERNVELQEMLDKLRAATVAQAEFTKQSQATRDAFDALANAEERIAIAQLTGAKRGLEGLKALGDARQKQIPVLEAEVQALEAIAKASGNKGLELQAEQARLSLERLKATADPLGDTFRDIFTGSATDALTDFITGTKSASEAFKSFADSVIQQISRIVAQNFAEQLFGKGSAGGSAIGDFFGGLFAGGLAGGGAVTPGKVHLVGENGPELFVPNTAGRVLTNQETRTASQARGGDTNITVAVQGNVDRRTRHQIANDIAREQRAGARLA